MYKIRISTVISLVIFIAACSAPNSREAKPNDAEKPNIVFILADDLGWKDVGYNGSEIRTPNIDALAASGMTLGRAYAYPICSPTRAALLTGQNPIKFGIDGPMEHDAQLPADITLLPEYLQRAGYTTQMIGKWHLGSGDVLAMPHNRGFDYFYGQLGGFLDFYTHVYFGGLDWQRNGSSVREEGYATHLQTADAVRLLNEHDGNTPFFMYLSYNSPHTPLQYPPEVQHDYAEIDNPDRQVFAQMMTDLDTSIGRVIAALKANGLHDNTLIVFMSDNGGNLLAGASNGQLRGSKGDALEGGVRVPSFVVWPAHFEPNRISMMPVFVQDWAPSLLHVAGAEIPASLEGRNIWPSLESDSPIRNREPVILGTGAVKAVYDWPLKLIRSKDNSVPDQLYDVVADPFEENDLAAARPEIVKRLSASLDTLPVKPSKGARGPKPETLFRDDDGNFIYDIRKPETREPWAESASGYIPLQ